MPFRGFNPSTASYRGIEGIEFEINASTTGIKGMLLLLHVLYAITTAIVSSTIEDRSLRISRVLSPCIGVSDIMGRVLLKDSILRATRICFKCRGFYCSKVVVHGGAMYVTDLESFVV